MGKDKGRPSCSSELLCLAEERLRSKDFVAGPSLQNEELQRLIHELQIYQIELEMQKEELRQAKAEKEEIEALLGKYNDLYDFAPVGYFNLDKGGSIRAVNLTGAGFLRVERSFLIGQRLDLFISHETRPVFHGFLDKVFASETKATCEVVFLKEGHPPLFVQVEAVASESKEECRAVVIDITERKLAEKKLRLAKEERERSFASVPDLIAILDNQHKVLRVNDAMAMRLGLKPEECIGLPCYEAVHGLPEPPRFCPHSRTIEDGREHIEEMHEKRLGGDFVVTTFPLLGEKGENIGTVHIARDITEQKRMEDALHESEQRIRLKLDSILTPEGDIGNLNLADIIDTKAIQSLMDDFYKLTHIPMGLNDLEGNVLVGVEWQEICTRFHREHPETGGYCIESNTRLSAGIPEGEFRLFKCKNNMWDIATPIMVGGKLIGNLFMGQFFFDDEQLDFELFRSQAAQYGFNEADYMAALAAVPRLSRESVETGMAYFMKLAAMISRLSYSNIKLARSLAERDALMDSLRKSQKQNEFLADIVRHAAQPFGQSYPDGRLGLINNAFELLTGYTYDELMTIDCAKALTPPEWQEFGREKQEELLRTGKPVRYEKEYIRKDGTRVPIELLSHVVTDSDGNPQYYYSFITDITDRKRAEEALRASEADKSLILNSTMDYVMYHDPDMKIVWVNWKVVELTNLPVEELIGRHCWEVVHKRDRPCEGCPVILAMDTGEHQKMEKHHTNGLILFMRAYPIKNDQGRLLGIAEFVSDITERKQAEEELQKSRDELEVRVRERTEQLTSLTAELSLAEERERHRIATELHDQVGQTLIFSKIKLNSLSHALSSESFGKLVSEIREYINQSIEEIRSLIFQLSPPLLYEVGFEAALEWLGEEFEEKYGFQVEFQDDGRKESLDEEASVALYQMVRELLLNAARHAKAKRVRVSVEKVPNKMKISVSDDGSGFDCLNGMRRKNKRSGFGLFNIRQRIEYLGGEFLIESEIGQGTRATLLLPLKK
jgi:PAS domain S-box-containing protein